MSVHKIEGFEYTCDKCGYEHRQENASGQYTEGTPPGWLTIKCFTVVSGRVDKLLCQKCADPFLQLISEL